jgi:hypothetical protein
MPTIEEVNARLEKTVNDGFQFFNKELDTFHAAPANDQHAVSVFLNRVAQYALLFWGYETVTKALGTASAEQIGRVGQMRAMVDGVQRQVQDLLNHLYQAQTSYQMPMGGQNGVEDFGAYQIRVRGEMMAKQQQMFNYTNRLRELVQGGIPFVQAQILARQETGYTG